MSSSTISPAKSVDHTVCVLLLMQQSRRWRFIRVNKVRFTEVWRRFTIAAADGGWSAASAVTPQIEFADCSPPPPPNGL